MYLLIISDVLQFQMEYTYNRCHINQKMTKSSIIFFGIFALLSLSTCLEIRRLAWEEPNCHQFDSNGDCKICSLRFYFDSSHQCQKVSDTCQEWDQTSGYCTSCYSGFELENNICVTKITVTDEGNTPDPDNSTTVPDNTTTVPEDCNTVPHNTTTDPENITIPENVDNVCCEQNILQVSGDATVVTQPDIAFISLSISATKPTTQQAVSAVNNAVASITQILSQNSIGQDDITTYGFYIYAQYNYNTNSTPQVVGQTASESLIVKVRNITKTGGNLGNLLDSLVVVNGIQLSGISYDKNDKSIPQSQARKLAFKNAEQKANDYALFSKRKLGKLLIIEDVVASYPTQALGATFISVGNLQISYHLQVTFALE